MCGICGIFNMNGEPVSPVTLRSMTDAIVHRGPDSEGFFVDSFIGLGHRRLSILDLSRTGHQPMQTINGDCAITYNGEVYNFLEIKKELEAEGFEFKSRTDTEVILNSYQYWGESCVHRFNGMFALAIWDRTRQELFLARDRYGVKPLYYTFADRSFIFASELKSILKHPDVHKSIDHEALIEYFTFQNIFTNKTLFQKVRLFPAGCWAKVPLGDPSFRLAASTIRRYWDFNFHEPEQVLADKEYEEELDRLFQQAVKRQLVSDVEIGSYLSGGMDSGSITAIAASHLPFIKTFTCGFDLHSSSGLELAYDEREKSEFMSYLFKTEHYEMVLKAGDMERVMPRMVECLEEPRVGQSYPNFYVSQLASKFVKVVLSGAGGDELFGGYPWRYYRAAVNDSFENYIDKYYLHWQRLIPNRTVKAVFSPIWNLVKHVWTRDLFRDVFQVKAGNIHDAKEYINHSLYFEAKTFLHGLLVVEDKLSMANSIETRLPFLDNDLVDFAMGLPVSLKLGNLDEVVRLNENEPGPKTQQYFSKTKDGKLILRRMMSKYIPLDITESVKQGFSAPDASWFKGDSLMYVQQALMNKGARIYELFDYRSVTDLLQEHLNGQKNRRLFIWSLLYFEEWLKQNF